MIGRTYIINIYRYEENEPDSLVGIVKDVEKGSTDKFNNINELWIALKPFTSTESLPKPGKDKVRTSKKSVQP